MSNSSEQRFSLAEAVVFGCITILAAQVGALATSECRVPNPNEVYCIAKKTLQTHNCEDIGQGTCGDRRHIERKLFPDGYATSTSGATTEEQHDCWRAKTLNCRWDMTEGKCVSDGEWNVWEKADKTVPNPSVTCPTNEG